MVILLKEFLNNTYHHIMEILKNDYILSVKTHNGNVVIMSEQKFESLIDSYGREHEKREIQSLNLSMFRLLRCYMAQPATKYCGRHISQQN